MMTTDREALVKRLIEKIDTAEDDGGEGLPWTTTEIDLILMGLRALTAQQPEPPQNPCTCVPDGDDGTVAHLCKWHRDHFATELEEANRRIADLEQRDDITMTAFGKLEAKFKAQVVRAEAAERQLVEVRKCAIGLRTEND